MRRLMLAIEHRDDNPQKPGYLRHASIIGHGVSGSNRTWPPAKRLAVPPPHPNIEVDTPSRWEW
jgi:hypothetical protein